MASSKIGAVGIAVAVYFVALIAGAFVFGVLGLPSWTIGLAALIVGLWMLRREWPGSD